MDSNPSVCCASGNVFLVFRENFSFQFNFYLFQKKTFWYNIKKLSFNETFVFFMIEALSFQWNFDFVDKSLMQILSFEWNFYIKSETLTFSVKVLSFNHHLSSCATFSSTDNAIECVDCVSGWTFFCFTNVSFFCSENIEKNTLFGFRTIVPSFPNVWYSRYIGLILNVYILILIFRYWYWYLDIDIDI